MKKILLFGIGFYAILSSSVLSGYTLADLWSGKLVADVKKQDIRQIFQQDFCADGLFFAGNKIVDEHPYGPVKDVATQTSQPNYKGPIKDVAISHTQPCYKRERKDIATSNTLPCYKRDKKDVA